MSTKHVVRACNAWDRRFPTGAVRSLTRNDPDGVTFSAGWKPMVPGVAFAVSIAGTFAGVNPTWGKARR